MPPFSAGAAVANHMDSGSESNPMRSSRPTLLLIGATGQIGSELRNALMDLGTVCTPSRSELDLRDERSIRRCVDTVRPGLIVNVAAYTEVDRAESEPDLAHRINATAPGILAEAAESLGAPVVHYSTDYVFDGRKDGAYREDDHPAPLNAYGQSKLIGEDAVRDRCAQHLVLRTSWVYGLTGKNFLRTMLRLAGQRDELRVVNDQVGAPTWSRAVAEATAAILSQARTPEGFDLGPRAGLYHLTARGSTTWYGFAREIVSAAGFAERVCVEPISTDEYPTAAMRPANSRLDCSRLETAFGVRLPHWRQQLELVMAELQDTHEA
jgi:dTDP-4-dehydrorhamnose reductase